MENNAETLQTNKNKTTAIISPDDNLSPRHRKRKNPKYDPPKMVRKLQPGCIPRFIKWAEKATVIPLLFILLLTSAVILMVFVTIDQRNVTAFVLLVVCFIILGILGPILGDTYHTAKQKKKRKTLFNRTIGFLRKGSSGIILVFSLEDIFDISANLGRNIVTNSTSIFPLHEENIRSEMAVYAVVCAFVSVIIFAWKLFVISLLKWEERYEYGLLDKRSAFIHTYSQPLAISLSDIADVLLVTRVVVPTTNLTIQLKDIVIYVFLLANVWLTEFQTYMAKVKEMYREPPDDERLEEGDDYMVQTRKRKIRDHRLQKDAKFKRDMSLKVRLQTIFVANGVIPIVLVTFLQNELSVIDSCLILLPLLGALLVLCNMISESYFGVRIFAYSLNEASRDILVRTITLIWVVILGTTSLVTSFSHEKQTLIFFFYGLYILVPLLFHVLAEWKTRHIFGMPHRAIGAVDRELDYATRVLFRSAKADTLDSYASTKYLSLARIEKIMKTLKPEEDLGRFITKDIAYGVYTYLEGQLKEGSSNLSESLRLMSMALSGVYYSKDLDIENSNRSINYIGINTIYLGELKLSAENFISHLQLGNIMTHSTCNIVSLDLNHNCIGDEGAFAIGEILAVNGTLRNLNLARNQIGPQGGKAIGEGLQKNSTLVVLELQGNKVGDPGAIAIGRALAGRSVLFKLNLISNKIGVSGAVAIGEALRTNQTLKALHLAHNDVADEGAIAIARALQTNATILVLGLFFNGIGDLGAGAIGNALKKNRALIWIDLRINDIEDDGACSLAEALHTNTTLITLLLWHNKIGPEGGEAIGNALHENKSLRELNLWQNYIRDDGAATIGKSLEKNVSLTELSLVNNKIGDDGAKEVAEALKTNSTLQILHLGGNEICDDGANKIAEALKKNSTLQILRLGGNLIGPDGAKQIAEGLKKNSTLQTLYLASNNIGDDGAIAIGTSLKSNRGLRSLFLNDNNIGIEGAIGIADGLEINRSLRNFNMYLNQIKDEGAVAIALALKKNSRLTRLWIGNNQLTDISITEFNNNLKRNRALLYLSLDNSPELTERFKALLKTKWNKWLKVTMVSNSVGDGEIDDKLFKVLEYFRISEFVRYFAMIGVNTASAVIQLPNVVLYSFGLYYIEEMELLRDSLREALGEGGDGGE